MSRKLHIGGVQRAEGWEILNITAGPAVDHVCDARDLGMFADHTFDAIYASHVVEHFDYIDEVANTLAEWRRVLIPGGKLYVSVPDLDILANLFLLKDQLSEDERFLVMRMMFGGHEDQFDYHLVGFCDDFLGRYLMAAGYTNILKLASFDFFQDTSKATIRGIPISLNMTAENPIA